MRDYSKVSPQFWIGRTGKALRKNGAEALVVGMYLMTGPNSNMLGLYYLDLPAIAHQTGLGMEGASKGLQGCIDAGFCAYDDDAEVVWVYEMAAYQIAPSLKKDDKRCVGIQNEYDNLPECKHLRGFYRKYSLAFHMTSCRDCESPLEAPSKPLGSQEQEQEKEQEQEQGKKDVEQTPLDRSVPEVIVPAEPDPIQTIFAFWQKVMNSPKSALDENRKKLIRNALKSYSPTDICKAIRGCSKTPHNMGQNQQGIKYNGLDLILRNAEKIDYFIRLDDAQARAAKESLEDANARNAAEFLNDGQSTDANVIDMEPA